LGERSGGKSGVGLGLALGLVLGGSGCGGDDGRPVTSPGGSIFTPSVTTVDVVNQGGGFTPSPPAGSTCLVGGRRYKLTVGSGQLDWVKCIGDGVVPYREQSGSRPLLGSELKDLTTLLGKLTVVAPDGGCIVDAPMLSVTMTTALASQQYVDNGFQCSVKDKPYLLRTAIDDVLNQLDTLAK
jgi:hypothetical protein